MQVMSSLHLSWHFSSFNVDTRFCSEEEQRCPSWNRSQQVSGIDGHLGPITEFLQSTEEQAIDLTHLLQR